MKTIICDMDGVLAESRTQIDDEMKNLIINILKKNNLVIITGGNYRLIKYQVLNILKKSDINKIHCLSQQGLVYHKAGNILYEELMDEELKLYIIKIISNMIYRMHKLDLLKPIHYDMIEDRGCQVTLSFLGRTAPLEYKKNFDPSCRIRKAFVKSIKHLLPKVKMVIGGTSSIDFTEKGKDKGYGIKKWIENNCINQKDCIYLGDKLMVGGNDYPVKKIIKNYVQINSIKHTKKILSRYV